MSNIDKVIDYVVSFSKNARDIDPKLAFAIAKSDHEDGTTSLYLFGNGEGSDLTAIKMAEDSIPKLTSDDKTIRITADKITLEGVTIVQEPQNGVNDNVTDMSGTHTLGELFNGLDGK